MSEWQPMSSVPKDRWILLDMSYWYPDNKGITEVFVVACYEEGTPDYPWYAGDESYKADAPNGWIDIPKSALPRRRERKDQWLIAW